MRTIPSAAELLVVVVAFLRKRHDKWPKFHADVAANAIAIAERELGLGPAADAADRERLERLLGRSGDLPGLESELSEKLINGRIDESDELMAYLWASTLANVQIDQPNYATFRYLQNQGLPTAGAPIQKIIAAATLQA